MSRQLLALLCLLVFASATKLTLALDSYEKQCFYEILRRSGVMKNRSRSIRST